MDSPSKPNPPPAIGIPVPVSSADENVSKPLYPIPHHQHNTTATVPWSSGLCDCFSDMPSCCLTFWCPCITFGQLAEIVDKGSSSCGVNGTLYAVVSIVSAFFTGCNFACFYSCFYRTKMRQQYSLEEGACGDCLTHTFCESCALCQEYRELKSRGFDMWIGWDGNMERQRQNGGVAMGPVPPIVEGGMSR